MHFVLVTFNGSQILFSILQAAHIVVRNKLVIVRSLGALSFIPYKSLFIWLSLHISMVYTSPKLHSSILAPRAHIVSREQVWWQISGEITNYYNINCNQKSTTALHLLTVR
jgi:hypothetical protein